MTSRYYRNERLRNRRRSWGIGRCRCMVSNKRRGTLKKIHNRRRVHRFSEELRGARASCRRGRAEVYRQRDESLPQLHSGLQRRFRDWSDKSTWNSAGFSTPTEMAEESTWTEGDCWSEEEETFAGSREAVVSWVKGYASNSGCPANSRLLYGRNNPMKKRSKNKMKTAKSPSITPSEDTYINELEELYDKINDRDKETSRSRPALGTLVLVYLFRGYRMLMRLLFRNG
jgi:hypothetical protein